MGEPGFRSCVASATRRQSTGGTCVPTAREAARNTRNLAAPRTARQAGEHPDRLHAVPAAASGTLPEERLARKTATRALVALAPGGVFQQGAHRPPAIPGRARPAARIEDRQQLRELGFARDEVVHEFAERSVDGDVGEDQRLGEIRRTPAPLPADLVDERIEVARVARTLYRFDETRQRL